MPGPAESGVPGSRSAEPAVNDATYQLKTASPYPFPQRPGRDEDLSACPAAGHLQQGERQRMPPSRQSMLMPAVRATLPRRSYSDWPSAASSAELEPRGVNPAWVSFSFTSGMASASV